ncbi:MAG: hypothetical protein KatS3mg044_0625 [Rhodothermaceae bacterium]|nr:MAG: hypothetical protein KatS3mg044_0625 [Rhodothermaceae bacterium]
MTDIRRLVERVADAMGPEAAPERVEAVAQAVLEEVLGASAGAAPVERAPYDAPEPGERAILTAYGLDRPGILAAITGAVSDAGCNILDVTQKILQGYFTLIMLMDVASLHGSLQDLQKRLNDVGQQRQVRILVQHEDLFNAMHRP